MGVVIDIPIDEIRESDELPTKTYHLDLDRGRIIGYVDGKEADTVLVGEAMTAVYLEEGYHEVIFRYRNPAFTLGCVISFVSTGVLAGLYFWIYPARKKKGKYQK